MFEEFTDNNEILKITASDPLDKSRRDFRVVLRPVEIRNERYFQAEFYRGTQVFHENIKQDELACRMMNNVVGAYKQICISMSDKVVTYMTSSKGKVTRLEKKTSRRETVVYENNRRKKYILNEGDDIPAMRDLGVFTHDGNVAVGMYDKFKQINRFVEILDDVLKDRTGSLTLVDFGCGKSYLTFIVYHYLTNIRHIDATVIGYDLKADVVAKCNELAAKYGYSKLRFVVADISRDKLYDEPIDVVVSLHACDTATDRALDFAVKHNVPYIFSVPCCQHEVNNSIKKGKGDLDVLLKYGIVKERVSALLTDAIRAMLLEDAGYSVDVMEFVDLTHSPKNIMLRCVKTGVNARNAEKIRELIDKYHFDHTLYKLLNEK